MPIMTIVLIGLRAKCKCASVRVDKHCLPPGRCRTRIKKCSRARPDDRRTLDTLNEHFLYKSRQEFKNLL